MEVSNLKPTTAKLLLHLLLNDPPDRSTPALMAAVGTKDREAFYQARKQVDALGLVGKYRLTLSEKTDTCRENPTLDVGENRHLSEKADTPLSEISDTPVGENRHVSEKTDITLFDGHPLAEDKPARQRCQEADSLGAYREEALQAAYKDLFQEDLHRLVAREYLKLAGSAEAAFDAIEYAKQRNIQGKPAAYIKKVLEGRQRDAARVAIGPVPSDHVGELMEVTPAVRAGWAAAEEKLRRMGKGHLLDPKEVL